LRKQRDGLLDRLGRVIAKGRRLHRAITMGTAGEICRVSYLGLFFFFGFRHGSSEIASLAPFAQAGAFMVKNPMKPPPFSYHDPRTIPDALALLGRLENAKLLAGGQSLMPMLNMRFVLPDHIIDLNQVEGLAFIRESNGALEIGAMTRQRDLEFSDLIRRRCPLMHEAILNVGHRQTRNRGTLGGSLCHLDPSAELVSVATGADATVTV